MYAHWPKSWTRNHGAPCMHMLPTAWFLLKVQIEIWGIDLCESCFAMMWDGADRKHLESGQRGRVDRHQCSVAASVSICIDNCYCVCVCALCMPLWSCFPLSCLYIYICSTSSETFSCVQCRQKGTVWAKNAKMRKCLCFVFPPGHGQRRLLIVQTLSFLLQEDKNLS